MRFATENIFWIIAILIGVLFIGLLHQIMLPFVLGMAVAYILNPIAERLEKIGFSRFWATFFITVVFTIVLVTSLITFIPILYQQLVALIQAMPDYVVRVKELVEYYGRLYIQPDFSVPELGYEEALRQIARNFAGSTGELLSWAWTGGKAIFNILSVFLVTPVVAVFLLHDWDHMVNSVHSLIPRDHEEVVTNLATQVDDVVAGFLRGQVLVCIILGLFYAFSLNLVGLNSGALIGLLAGIMSFIPYVGATLGFIIGVSVAIAQFSPDIYSIGLVALVFVVGQIIEGNFLTPKIIGDKVRLHPVWLLFALFGFAYLFGFVGMLIAIPVAAAIGVLVRFAMGQYRQSEAFKGDDTDGGTTPQTAHTALPTTATPSEHMETS